MSIVEIFSHKYIMLMYLTIIIMYRRIVIVLCNMMLQNIYNILP